MCSPGVQPAASHLLPGHEKDWIGNHVSENQIADESYFWSLIILDDDSKIEYNVFFCLTINVTSMTSSLRSYTDNAISPFFFFYLTPNINVAMNSIPPLHLLPCHTLLLLSVTFYFLFIHPPSSPALPLPLSPASSFSITFFIRLSSSIRNTGIPTYFPKSTNLH